MKNAPAGFDAGPTRGKPVCSSRQCLSKEPSKAHARVPSIAALQPPALRLSQTLCLPHVSFMNLTRAIASRSLVSPAQGECSLNAASRYLKHGTASNTQPIAQMGTFSCNPHQISTPIRACSRSDSQLAARTAAGELSLSNPPLGLSHFAKSSA